MSDDIIERRPETLVMWPGEVPYGIPVGAVFKSGSWMPEDRDQDLVAFQYADGAWLDLGWYPSYSPEGHYLLWYVPGGRDWDDGRAILRSYDADAVAEAITNFIP